MVLGRNIQLYTECCAIKYELWIQGSKWLIAVRAQKRGHRGIVNVEGGLWKSALSPVGYLPLKPYFTPGEGGIPLDCVMN